MSTPADFLRICSSTAKAEDVLRHLEALCADGQPELCIPASLGLGRDQPGYASAAAELVAAVSGTEGAVLVVESKDCSCLQVRRRVPVDSWQQAVLAALHSLVVCWPLMNKSLLRTARISSECPD
jgi:hypothetical protein